MRRTAVLWEAFVTLREGRAGANELTAEEAGELLGMSGAALPAAAGALWRKSGAEGLRDRRLRRVSGRRAPESELARMRRLYREEGTVNGSVANFRRRRARPGEAN